MESLTKNSKIFKSPENYPFKEAGISSLFLIEIQPGRKAFRYDIEIKNLLRKKSLTKGVDDGQRSMNRNLCYELLTFAYSKTNGFGMEEEAEVVYDCKSTMYTSKPISLNKSEIIITNNEVNEFVQKYSCGANFSVRITPNVSCPILYFSNYNQYISKKSLYNEDRSVRTFLEMAITQFSLNYNIYTPVGTGKLFETSNDNSQSIENGIALRSGVAKGVRIVQNLNSPTPALVLDAKVCPFYQHQNLLDTVLSISKPRMPQSPSDWGRILFLLKDIRVEVSYARHRSFGIGRFTDKPMSQLFVSYEGSKLPMSLYYKKRYNIDIRYNDFPAVIPNTPVLRGKPIELFPIEELIVMEDQRVPVERMSKKLSATLLRANSIPPHQRLSKIMRHAHEMAVFSENNAVLQAFGISIILKSNLIDIGIRPCPLIHFSNNEIIQPNPELAEWRKATDDLKYIDTTIITNWVVLYNNERNENIDKFIDAYISLATKKGLCFKKDPIIKHFTSKSCFSEIFQSFIDNFVEFVILIDSKAEDTHGFLKYYEARYKILTQHITLECVIDVVKNGKLQTLNNIINKTNCKNFGLNYIPEIENLASAYDLKSNDILVFGYDVAHPGPMTAQERRLIKLKGISADSFDPSVVGISANMAKNPYVFTGDYFYQECRKESVDPIQLMERTQWILKNLENNRPQAARPKYIFVLRDGLSEGQFSMAVKEELEAIKAGCSLYDINYKPKFIFVIGTKRHFKKFFTIRKGLVQNLNPGSVISEKFVRVDCPEFFMMSHYPSKGVGKPVEYNIPVDEIDISQEELQAFLNTLCYSHQIVNSAVSLPEPIYQADELAKRGRNNYVTMKSIDYRSIPRLKSQLVDSKELTLMLSYMNSSLCGTRFTA